MHLDTTYVYAHCKTYESRRVKTTYILERREYFIASQQWWNESTTTFILSMTGHIPHLWCNFLVELVWLNIGCCASLKIPGFLRNTFNLDVTKRKLHACEQNSNVATGKKKTTAGCYSSFISFYGIQLICIWHSGIKKMQEGLTHLCSTSNVHHLCSTSNNVHRHTRYKLNNLSQPQML